MNDEVTVEFCEECRAYTTDLALHIKEFSENPPSNIKCKDNRHAVCDDMKITVELAVDFIRGFVDTPCVGCNTCRAFSMLPSTYEIAYLETGVPIE